MTEKVNRKSDTATASGPEDVLAAAIARRIGALRKAQGFTFDALARRAGLSKGTLVQIEQEAANPSIATLCRLSAALGVSVADLVTQPGTGETQVRVTAAADGRRLWTGPKGGSAVLLAGASGPDMLEMWQWELKAGERFDAARHGRGTRELIHVSSGTLVIDVAGEDTIVAAGATAMARTDRPHAYVNRGPAPVRFLMAVHEPLSVP